MSIPKNQWNPWVGERLKVAWRYALFRLNSEKEVPYRDLCMGMLRVGAEPLAPKTVQNIMSRAKTRGVVVIDRKTGMVALSPTAPPDWILEPVKMDRELKTQLASLIRRFVIQANRVVTIGEVVDSSPVLQAHEGEADSVLAYLCGIGELVESRNEYGEYLYALNPNVFEEVS